MSHRFYPSVHPSVRVSVRDSFSAALHVASHVDYRIVSSFYCPRGSDGLYRFHSSFFFSVRTITHEPLDSVWRNFARTCTSTTSRTLLNFKVEVTWASGCFLCAWCCGCPRTVLSLEQGLIILFSVLSVLQCSFFWQCRLHVIFPTVSFFVLSFLEPWKSAIYHTASDWQNLPINSL